MTDHKCHMERFSMIYFDAENGQHYGKCKVCGKRVYTGVVKPYSRTASALDAEAMERIIDRKLKELTEDQAPVEAGVKEVAMLVYDRLSTHIDQIVERIEELEEETFM